MTDHWSRSDHSEGKWSWDIMNRGTLVRKVRFTARAGFSVLFSCLINQGSCSKQVMMTHGNEVSLPSFNLVITWVHTNVATLSTIFQNVGICSSTWSMLREFWFKLLLWTCRLCNNATTKLAADGRVATQVPLLTRMAHTFSSCLPRLIMRTVCLIDVLAGSWETAAATAAHAAGR